MLFNISKDLQSFVTKSVKEIEHVMNVGNQNRAVGYVNVGLWLVLSRANQGKAYFGLISIV